MGGREVHYSGGKFFGLVVSRSEVAQMSGNEFAASLEIFPLIYATMSLLRWVHGRGKEKALTERSEISSREEAGAMKARIAELELEVARLQAALVKVSRMSQT